MLSEGQWRNNYADSGNATITEFGKPAGIHEGSRDIAIEGDKIAAVVIGLSFPFTRAKSEEMNGKLVMPVDCLFHNHFLPWPVTRHYGGEYRAEP